MPIIHHMSIRSARYANPAAHRLQPNLRRFSLATQYIAPKRFVEHNPGVADVVGGLTEFIHQSPNGRLHVTVVRAIQDGSYVVTQGTRERSGQDVFFEIFRFEEGVTENNSNNSSPPLP